MSKAILYYIGPQGLIRVGSQATPEGFWEQLKITTDLLQEEQAIAIMVEKPLSAIQVDKISHAFNYGGKLGGLIIPRDWTDDEEKSE